MAAATEGMVSPSLGGSWQHLPSCESTNDELVRLGRAGAPSGTVLTTDAQTRGRGRQGRAWHSPSGESLYLSVLLRPPLPPHRAPMLCLAAGLALYDAVDASLVACDQRHAVDLRLKWPNDLLAAPAHDGAAHYQKLGGILTELFGSAGSIDFVVIGVGCNVRSADFPPGVPGTSLRLLLPLDVGKDRPDVLLPRALAERFLASLQTWYERYLTGGAAAITTPFSQAARLGPDHGAVRVRAGRDEAPLCGVPVGLGQDGELLLQTERGIERVLSGDVEMTRLHSAAT